MEKGFSGVAVVEYRDDYAFINIIQSRLVAPQSGEVIKGLADEAIRKGYKKIVIDFSQVEFMSSSMLGTLISISNRLKAIKGAVKITGLKPSIRELFTITKLDGIFNIS
ncbi:STAS domain-containing protein [PVC group bacterium]|nr:STAS domain-containing protein [PVC group bacterium]